MSEVSLKYNEYTKLPVVVFRKAESLAPVLEVTTPKGKVFIDLEEVDRLMFVSGTDHVISEILKLENEAKEFLLDKWIKSLI